VRRIRKVEHRPQRGTDDCQQDDPLSWQHSSTDHHGDNVEHTERRSGPDIPVRSRYERDERGDSSEDARVTRFEYGINHFFHNKARGPPKDGRVTSKVANSTFFGNITMDQKKTATTLARPVIGVITLCIATFSLSWETNSNFISYIRLYLLVITLENSGCLIQIIDWTLFTDYL
jgi:hypothetical protein